MAAGSINNTKKAFSSLSVAAVLILLVLCIWKCNIETEILIPFLFVGILSAIILCLIKKIQLPNALTIFSCVFASLVCSGLYTAFIYLFERYMMKYDISAFGSDVLVLSSASFSLPGLIISFLAYPAVLTAVAWISLAIVNGLKALNAKALSNEIKNSLGGKQLVKIPCLLLLNLAIAAGLGTLLIWAVYSLPIDRIDDNMKSSADLLYNEGTYPSLYSWCFSRSDNFSDAIIMLEASDRNDASAVENAMLSYRGNIEGLDPVHILKMHFIDGAEYDSEISYSRYWQGYLTTIKPLLQITDYEGIRILNYGIQIVLSALICLMMSKRGRKDIIIPFLIIYLMLMPPVMGRCLFFSSCYLVTLASVLALLLIKNEKWLPYLFLYTGIAAVYVDLMSFPILTFGIPAVLCLSLHAEDSFEHRLILTLKNGLTWCLGFAGMWILKWIIGDLITGEGVIRAALDMVAVRTSVSEAGSEAFSIYSVFGRNIIAFVFTPATLLVISYIIYLINRVKKNTDSLGVYSSLFLAALISLIPFFWYTFAANHSIIHYWFTCKSLVIPIFAVMCGLSDVLHGSIQHKEM